MIFRHEYIIILQHEHKDDKDHSLPALTFVATPTGECHPQCYHQVYYIIDVWLHLKALISTRSPIVQNDMTV